jgi:hypothetical protein
VVVVRVAAVTGVTAKAIQTVHDDIRVADVAIISVALQTVIHKV